jgi:hypothetical protein
MKLPTHEEFESFKRSKNYQVSADEVYQWFIEFVTSAKDEFDINKFSSVKDHVRLNHWIHAPIENKDE